MASISNLLARGYQSNIEPLSNVLMRQQQLADGKQRNALMQMQMQAAQEQAAERQQNALMQRQLRDSIPSPQAQAVEQAFAAPGRIGPTRERAAAMPAVNPRLQMLHGAMRAGGDPMAYINEAFPAQQKPTQKVVGDTLLEVGPGGVRELYKSAPKPAGAPSSVAEYEYAKGQGYRGTFEQWDTGRKKAGATTVSIAGGQKGYENESKLRNDFKAEPIYKDYVEMATAYKQIKAGLNAKTPIGDVAAATKVMKLLDPGSVVRESELAIAMAAAGKLDRLQNYLQMKISGETLTPTQRSDFGALAQELFEAAGDAYNSKRKEYADMGSRYGLGDAALGAAHVSTRGTTKPAAAPGNLSADETAELKALRKRFNVGGQ